MADTPGEPPSPMPSASENLALCCSPWLSLQRSCLLQQVLHARPALARGLFRRAATVPVGFKAHSEVIAVALERLKLSGPVDDPFSHRRPRVVLAPLYCVLAMAVANALLWQKIVAIGLGRFPVGSGVPRIPVQHKMRRLHRA